jgi:predicted transcriptional regulator
MAEPQTITFVTDEDQVARIDALAQEFGRSSRSAVLRQVIDAGIPVLKAARQVQDAMRRAPLPEAAFPNADADLAVA